MGILKQDLKPAPSCKELHCSLSWPCSATGFHPVCLRGHRCQTPPHLTRPCRELRCHPRRQHPTCQRQQRQSHVDYNRPTVTGPFRDLREINKTTTEPQRFKRDIIDCIEYKSIPVLCLEEI